MTSKKSTLGPIVMMIYILTLIHQGYFSNAFTMAANHKITLQQRIHNALHLTTQGQSNVTAAYAAVSAWSVVFSTSSATLSLQPKVIALCKSLYASSLARVGNDEYAIQLYEEGLQIISTINSSSISMTNSSSLPLQTEETMTLEQLDFILNSRIGKGEALQRLMHYQEAKDEFLKVNSLKEASEQIILSQNKYKQMISDAVYSAVTCCFRIGNILEAYEILLKQYQWEVDTMIGGGNNVNPNIAGLLGTLSFFYTGQLASTTKDTYVVNAKELLLYASSCNHASPVFKWFYEIAKSYSSNIRENRYNPSILQKIVNTNIDNKEYFLNMISINQSPFDDPYLIQLDDKIFLQQLLTTKFDNPLSNDCYDANHFWPLSFTFPRDANQFQNYISMNYNPNNDDKWKKVWILKDRAGYGSHGNTLLSNGEALQYLHNVAMKSANSTMNTIIDQNDEPYNWSTFLTYQNRINQKSTLCQKLVDPPLLLHGYKFSLRVYVYYFPSSPFSKVNMTTPLQNNYVWNHLNEEPIVYVSKLGLVKLASSPYTYDDATNDASSNNNHNEKSLMDYNRHMTNSGRINGRSSSTTTTTTTTFITKHDIQDPQQYDFEYLQQYLNHHDDPVTSSTTIPVTSTTADSTMSSSKLDRFTIVWNQIEKSIHFTMTQYSKYKQQQQQHGQILQSCVSNDTDQSRRRDSLNHDNNTGFPIIPKIMGFDYIIDQDYNPWLMEVNRFPGLEPRDENDYKIKTKVVKNAWKLASMIYFGIGTDTDEDGSDVKKVVDDTNEYKRVWS